MTPIIPNETRLSSAITKRLLHLYSARPANSTLWYDNVQARCRELARVWNLSLSQVAGVVAALSPGLSWDSNIDYAIALIASFAIGQRGRKLPLVGSYGWRNVEKAESILLGHNPLSVLGGAKVRAFYQSIMNPNGDSLCLDRHAYFAAIGIPLDGRNGRDVEATQFFNRITLRRMDRETLSPSSPQGRSTTTTFSICRLVC